MVDRLIAWSTPADLLVAAIALPPLADPPQPLPPGTRCTITGQPLTEGYPVSAVTTDATAEFLDMFRDGQSGWLSVNAARCFRSANPRAGNPLARSLAVFQAPDGTVHGWQPLIAREAAAAQERPCWRDLVRTVWPARQGQTCFLLLTTDTKKRLWPYARIGTLGARTPWYAYDAATAQQGTRWIDWPVLVQCLDAVEYVYTCGYSKDAIRTGLAPVKGRTALEASALERRLAGWRSRPEFPLAVLIAQRDDALLERVASFTAPARLPAYRPLTAATAAAAAASAPAQSAVTTPPRPRGAQEPTRPWQLPLCSIVPW